MCLYPTLIINRKYTPTAKNNYNPPKRTDDRVKYVPIGCQKCMECKQQKARAWQVRLTEDIRHNKNGKFVTLTFTDEALQRLEYDEDGVQEERYEGLEGYQLENEIATKAVRLFLERYRKKHGVSIRHWLVTELGHEGTERIHLHGILWTDEPLTEIEKIWSYGWMWKGKGDSQQNYVNESTVNYITKYINKLDKDHKGFEGKILTSKGIGRDYVQRPDFQRNKYNENGETKEEYRLRDGGKVNLPIYYRNKLYTEKEREKLWIQKIDKNIRWIAGTRLDNPKPEDVMKVLKQAQERNKKLGYGDGTKNWDEEQYEQNRRKLIREERKQKQLTLKKKKK